MKIDTRMVLKDHEGKPLTHQEEDGVEQKEVGGKMTDVPKVVTKDTTLKYILMLASTNSMANEIIPAERKAALYEIATKCVITHEPNFTESEINIIKERVNVLWPSSIVLYGVINDIFNGKIPTTPSVPVQQAATEGVAK